MQQEKEKEYGCYQMKLRGNAWYTSNGQQVSQAHLLVMNLLTVMDNMGYELAACVDMSTGTGEDFNDSTCVPEGADSSRLVVLRR